MGNRILYSNMRAQTGPQVRGKIQFVVRHFEFVRVEFFVAHALWFFRLVYYNVYLTKIQNPNSLANYHKTVSRPNHKISSNVKQKVQLLISQYKDDAYRNSTIQR